MSSDTATANTIASVRPTETSHGAAISVDLQLLALTHFIAHYYNRSRGSVPLSKQSG